MMGVGRWPKVRLDTYADLLAGFAFKSSQFTDKPEDVPLVKGENVGQGRILWDISKRWPRNQLDGVKRFELIPTDIVVAMDRPWVPAGLKWAVIRKDDPKALLVQRVARLRAKNGLTQDFLRFVIGGPDFENYVRPITTGVNVPHISGRQILDFEFMLPPLPHQRRIAAILSAYDDLINNDERRIQILEHMARVVYREWFVEFRFPGHEKVPLVQSSFGLIPADWSIKTLGSVIELHYGKALKQDERRKGSVPVFGSSGVIGYHDQALVQGPGVIVGRKGNVGSVFWSDVDFYPIDTVFFVKTSLPLRFLYYDLQTKQFLNSDAAVPGLSRHQAYALETIVPPSELLTRFCETAEAFERCAVTLRQRVANLRRTRELLLPRLLSGQVGVAPTEA